MEPERDSPVVAAPNNLGELATAYPPEASVRKRVTATFVLIVLAGPHDWAIFARGDQTSAPATPTAEKTAGEVLKNVQVLTDVPASEWTNVMFFIAGSLGVGCEHCHVQPYDADTKEAKRTARAMMQMVHDINAARFAGKPVVTCNTCHRGTLRPQGVPSLWNKTPDEVVAYKRQQEEDRAVTRPPPAGSRAALSESLPTARQVFEKYRNAVGGAPFNTLHLAGTIAGDIQPSQRVEYDVVFPDKLFVRLSLQGGAAQTVVINGDQGWIATPQGTRNLDPATVANVKSNPLIQSIKFGELEASAQLIETERSGDRIYTVVEAQTPKAVRRLYFDAQSGLLYKTHLETRVASFGISPAETIFEDYREVNGTKIPFSITGITTADRIRTRISEMRVNEPIDVTRFKAPLAVGGR